MDELKREIAKNIFFYRKERGISRKMLAEKIGVTVSSISHWENERNSIDIDTLYKVCLVLNVSISDMFGALAKNSEEVYSSYERNLIFNVRKLNNDGKEYLQSQIDYALMQKKFLLKTQEFSEKQNS